MVISDQFNLLSKKARVQLRNEFCKETDISIITFYKRMKADRFSPLEKNFFISLLNKYAAVS